jgi:preprotein translocase subunit SecA
MIKKITKFIFGDQNLKAIKKIQPLVKKINAIEAEYQNTVKDQNDVLAKTSEFKERVKNGESLEKLLPEAFALVKTACRHLQGKSWPVRGKDVEWQMIPYDVQLVGGVVLHQGNVTEMKTGEGKTLVCTMPVYLNALTEKGVFLVTVNDYLAQRDAEWMEGLYNYLGLSVGVITHGQSVEGKKAAYSCDVTYGTNNEFGFDYLRDNMTTEKENVVQRHLHYAIVDEVDSILIDEARTPLIISAPAAESTSKYQEYSRLIPQLKDTAHYEVDEKGKTASLTEDGIHKMEEMLGLENIYTEAGFSEVHHIEQALRAQACYKKDVDYMVKEGQIMIIDEFTGRLMPGRRYGNGLHQAIEAKEKVEVKRQSKTLATVSFQNYFRLFEKLAGMTGTAETEAEEFYTIYGLDTIVIPTNKPIARDDKNDLIFRTTKGKYIALARRIKEFNATEQPVLVGTISVEQSEIISKLLKMEGVNHKILNAKQHEREAEIVAEAGMKGSVTIATNMAGRGTDIKLGEGVIELGGLAVLGTERHESRRIDNQLRGRSGRQGDPGVSQFFVSMEDELMRLFGGDRIKSMMTTLKVPEDMPIETRIISRSIETAQKRVEGRNFDIRKHLVEYDDVLNIQRNIIYKRRRELLGKEDLSEHILEMISEIAEAIVLNQTEARPVKEWNYEEIFKQINSIHEDSSQLKLEDLQAVKEQGALIAKVKAYLTSAYQALEAQLPDPSIMRQIEQAVVFRATDKLWMDHIDEMSQLRQSVAFSGMAQKNPLIEYKQQGFEKFQELLAMVRQNSINTLFKVDLNKVVPQIMIRQKEKELKTNEDEVSAPLSGERKSMGSAPNGDSVSHSTFDSGNASSNSNNPVVVKVSAADQKVPEKAANPTIIKVNADDTPNPVAMSYNRGAAANSAEQKLPEVGRNEPCPCGSGKKYKKCHAAN